MLLRACPLVVNAHNTLCTCVLCSVLPWLGVDAVDLHRAPVEQPGLSGQAIYRVGATSPTVSTRLRPWCLALYIASSAAWISVSVLGLS